MPAGFHLLMAAQFVSALADNALIIVAIALLQQQGHPAWWAPMLKFCFTIAYVVLAPLEGPLADAFVKPRLMMAMNALKVLGGALISPEVARLGLRLWPAVPPLDAAIVLLLVGYALAALLNLGIPDSGVRYRRAHRAPLALWRSFSRAQRRLWQDAEGSLSMAVTTLFWGAAAVMQFAVLRWAVDVLGLSLDRAAYLQGTVAVGIVAGAAVAGRYVALAQAWRVLPLGVAMGLVVPVITLVDGWLMALPLLLLVGALGGAMVVPLNALLQYRGHQLLTAGRSIAVQNFNENLSMLVMLGVFALLLALEVSAAAVVVLLGLLVASVMAVLTLRETLRRREGSPAAGRRT